MRIEYFRLEYVLFYDIIDLLFSVLEVIEFFKMYI